MSRFINRELSWLEFNQRVLDEASTPTLPLLERLTFLAITGSNLDEFFMVRVGGLQMLVAGGSTKADPAGLTPAQQVEEIGERVRQLSADQYSLFLDDLEPKLAEAGIQRIPTSQLSDRQADFLAGVFETEILPILTPIALGTIDAADREFPTLAGRTINMAVRLTGVDEGDSDRFAVIPFGTASRYLTLPSKGGYSYTLLEDVVALHLSRFFPGMKIVEATPFRVTRNADIEIREDLAGDLLGGMEDILDARKQGGTVRLEIAEEASDEMRAFLEQRLELTENDVYRCRGPLDISSLFRIAGLTGFEQLKYEPWPPCGIPGIEPTTDLFELMREGDILLHHPYETFDPVMRLVETASRDPDVLAIKQTLYRTSAKSPIIDSLIEAARRGKHVTTVVEVKARFDEARNIEWAKKLEQEGVHVLYGVKGLKTHAKCCLIIRRSAGGIQRFAHFGTGNYNENTAKLYSDLSLLTCDEDLTSDATAMFHAITGYSHPVAYRKLEMAPIGLRERLLELIEGEAARIQQNQPAGIDVKTNSLVDSILIDALFRAAEKGVPIRLHVRGICCLKPQDGLPIRVVSTIDRHLEHARIFRFHHGGDDLMFFSSADWMPRNLDRRVELLVPVEGENHKRRLREILDIYFADNTNSQELRPDGRYHRVVANAGEPTCRSQQVLFERAKAAVERERQSKLMTFEPHRSRED